MARSTIDLHLFSTPGPKDDLEWVVEACRPYLEGKPEPTVACLPLAILSPERELEAAEAAFRGLARIAAINTETMELAEMESVLRRADVAYIPGGNTFMLNHRLHISGIFPYLRQKIQTGLPYVGVSAGTVLCGPNILTSNDINMVSTTHFDGLKLTPFNFNMHYVYSPAKDEWLSDYRCFHDNPVLLMEDDACIKIHGKSTRLTRGDAWLWRAGQDKERIEAGEEIMPYA